MVKERSLVVRALRTRQGREKGIDVYAFFAPGSDISEIAEISRVQRSQKQKLEGFQRREIKNHVNAIVEYLDHGNALFPNAIILALADEVVFKQARGSKPAGLVESSEAGTLVIPIRQEGERVAWIVDGQQRSLALARTKDKGLSVPVIAFFAPDLDTQREQFILVNKAKPLPNRLINELLPEVDTHLPRDLSLRKLPSSLVDLLSRDPNSPFNGLIKRVSEPKNQNAVISDSALIDAIKKSINSPLGTLSQYKMFGDSATDTENMYVELLLFWSCVKSVFGDAWGLPPTKSRLMHSAGINAMGTLMDRVVMRASAQSNPKAHIKKSLQAIAPLCCWTEGTWRDIGLDWNEIQNVPRHKKLLAEQLVRLDYEANFNL